MRAEQVCEILERVGVEHENTCTYPEPRVRMRAFGDPGQMGAYGPLSDEKGARQFALTVTKRSGNQLVARVEGVSDRDAAAALKGQKLYVPRDRLPPLEESAHYCADLIGLRAESPDGAALGFVRAVFNFGAGDLLEISGEEERLVPFTRAAVPVVDVDRGRLVVSQDTNAVEQKP